MRFHKALYLKELKQHRVVFAIYFALNALVAVMLWMNESWFSIPRAQKITYPLYWMGHGLELFLPALLVYSWFHEQRGKTSYQLLSLPVNSPAILLHKYLAFCTAVLAANLMNIPGLLQEQLYIPSAHPVLMGFALILFPPIMQITLLSATIMVIGAGQEYHEHRLLNGLAYGWLFFIWIFFEPLSLYISFESEYVNTFNTRIDNAIHLVLLNLLLAVNIFGGLHQGLSSFNKNLDG